MSDLQKLCLAMIICLLQLQLKGQDGVLIIQAACPIPYIVVV